MARPGPALVADASVLVKWFLKEEDSEAAMRLRASHVSLETKIVVPSLARYEVLNALRYSGRFGTLELVRASRQLEEFGLVEVSPDRVVWEGALNISADCGLTVYDSCYVSLGRENHLLVYTADEKMLERAASLGVVRHIKVFGV